MSASPTCLPCPPKKDCIAGVEIRLDDVERLALQPLTPDEATLWLVVWLGSPLVWVGLRGADAAKLYRIEPREMR
jgi:hypothetical protein